MQTFRASLRRALLLATACSLHLSAMSATLAAAQTNEIRLATQPSLSFTPLFVMKERKLIEKHAAALGLDAVTTTWTSFSSGTVMNDSLLANQIDVAVGGVSGFLVIWDRTRGKGAMEVKGVAAINSASFNLYTTRMEVNSVKDLGDKDRIAVPAVKTSIQAVLLQMAAAQAFGETEWGRLDSSTVAMAHPDAYSLLSSGKSELNGHFSGPPYQYDQLKDPKLKKVLSSSEVTGGPMTMNMVWSIGRFRDSNPKAYQAVLSALEEALEFTRKEPRAAGEFYMANVKSKVQIDEVLTGLTDPETTFSTAPQRSTALAQFLVRTGMLKTKADSWKDFFFPEVHGKSGS
jgi:NitT/TauT family transport system substrate-binding protein